LVGPVGIEPTCTATLSTRYKLEGIRAQEDPLELPSPGHTPALDDRTANGVVDENRYEAGSHEILGMAELELGVKDQKKTPKVLPSGFGK
jgi:hypothetical protein